MKNTCNKGIWLLFTVLIVSFQSCTDSMRQSFEVVPNALGVTNEIVVIADDDIWEGPIGDTIRYYYGAAYPIMPQPEPMFDLRHFTPTELNSDRLRKELRTYLFVGDLSNTDSPTSRFIAEDIGQENVRRSREDEKYFSSIGRERWASGQLLVYVFANSEEKLKSNIIRSYSGVAKLVNQHDKPQIEAAVYLEGQQYKAIQSLREKFGIELKVPGDYVTAIEEDNFIWMKKDTRELTSNLMITRVPYTSRDQFSKEALIALQDSLGQKYISSTIRGSFMKTNDVDLPVFLYEKQIQGHYAVEARGIWEMYNDYMGGPFTTYLILDEPKNEIIFIQGFLFAPGKRKRKFVQHLEHIVNSLKVLG